MDWLLAATIAYFIMALVVILDKFLLSSKRISHPAIYTFYSGVLSLFSLLIFPLGFHLVDLARLAPYILAGIFFNYGVLSLFFAIQKGEASRVTPAVGAIIPIATYFFSMLILGEKLSFNHLTGVSLLILGGLSISWEFSPEKKRFYAGLQAVAAAGILLALSFTLTKYLYEEDSFVNVFIWTRLGFSLGALSLLLVPDWRRRIIHSLGEFKKPGPADASSGALFVLNKILGGVGSVMLNFAIYLGSVTVINALIALEYIFVFILASLFSLWVPKIFQENITLTNSLQKISSILIITFGLILVAN